MDKDALRQKPIPYLGWWLEGEPGPPGTGTYRWYANEDKGPKSFRILFDVSRLVSDRDQQYGEAMSLGLAYTEGTIFLGVWPTDEELRVSLPMESSSSSQEVREGILRGLYRLREAGFADGSFQIDLQGVALVSGVDDVRVQHAVEFLFDEALIQDYGTIGRNRRTGDIWLTSAGVKHVEEQISTRIETLYPTRSILFTDVEGSTALTERLGDEAARTVLREYENLVRDTILAHGGKEVKNTGDGLMAVFGSATYAVRSAIAIQEAVSQKYPTERAIRIKIGINAGDAIEEDRDYFGRAVNLAARLCDAADGGQILISRVVKELSAGDKSPTVSAGGLQLKGIKDPVEAFRVGGAISERKSPLELGDFVRHKRFGRGVVLSCEPSGRDYQVVVSFEGEAGVKKLLHSFAPLEKIELPPPAPKIERIAGRTTD